MGKLSLAASLLLLTALSHAAFAADPVFGRWAADRALCDEADALTVSAKAVQRASDRCTVGKVYKVGRALYVEARCGAVRRAISVKFDLVGLNRLAVTWDKNPVEHMTRCR